MVTAIEQYREAIAQICAKYRVARLEVFGSAAKGALGVDSDVDFFYEFESGDVADIADRFFDLKADLESVLGRRVDLVSAKDVRNAAFLEVANRHRVTLYAA